MKTYITLLSVTICLLFMGCSNNFAEDEYDSADKIIEAEDRYSTEVLSGTNTDSGYSLTVSEFNGRETLWADTLEESLSVTFDISYSFAGGKAKLVHIDPEGTVTTLMECTADTSDENQVTKTILMASGKNRIKLVGFDVETLEVTMSGTPNR